MIVDAVAMSVDSDDPSGLSQSQARSFKARLIVHFGPRTRRREVDELGEQGDGKYPILMACRGYAMLHLASYLALQSISPVSSFHPSGYQLVPGFLLGGHEIGKWDKTYRFLLVTKKVHSRPF